MSKTILIVDDSEMIRNYHAYALKSAGFNVISAVNGADAMELVYQHDIDLIITDINMPVMDGYAFIENVRREEGYKNIPIIIVSTEDEAGDKKRGFEAGADLYIIKPVDPKNLVENVKLLLGE